MNRFRTIFLTILFCSQLVAVFGQKIEIPFEGEYLKDVKQWVDDDGFTIIDLRFTSNNHYFYMISPHGKIVSEYKNFYLNLYYKGFTSNKDEFTLYFSRTPKGKIEFLDFFKSSERPPVTTLWENEPKDYFQSVTAKGNLLFMDFDKKKSNIEFTYLDGPVSEKKSFTFEVPKEMTKEIVKSGYMGMGIDNIYSSHFGSALVFFENQQIIVLKTSKEELINYTYDLADQKFTMYTYPYPDQSEYFGTTNGSFLVDDKVFLLTMNMNRLCLDVLDLELNPIVSKCYGKDQQLELKTAPAVYRNGKNAEETWVGGDKSTSRILRELSQHSFGYISVMKKQDGGYSLKLGSESASSMTPGVMIGSGAGVSSSGNYQPPTSLCFTGSLTRDFEPYNDDKNYFETIFQKTEFQFVGEFGVQNGVIATKDFFYHFQYNRKDSKLEIERFTFD
ncbi:MAG: hypothetical protein ABJH04_12805 [Cyclobacteriaceae bacterium]